MALYHSFVYLPSSPQCSTIIYDPYFQQTSTVVAGIGTHFLATKGPRATDRAMGEAAVAAAMPRTVFMAS